MCILKKKNICVLGLGHHGGGIASVKFAHYSGAATIFISDKKTEKELSKSLSYIKTSLQIPIYAIETGNHSIIKIRDSDIVIKNPAIPRTSPIIQDIKNKTKTIETDISLYLKSIQTIPKATKQLIQVISGTKGKSSVSTAFHKWRLVNKHNSSLAGNITYSPLHYIINNTITKELILELSSFQLGDLELVNSVPYQNIDIGLLTNILPDHQNYYKNLEEYAQDKLTFLTHLSSSAHAILPYDNTLLQNKIQTLSTECTAKIFWHSTTPLPHDKAGVWCKNDTLFIRTHAYENVKKTPLPKKNLRHIYKNNITALSALCIVKNINIPQTLKEWEYIFSLPHRKEKLCTFNGISIYNDSAASIPSAMCLPLFQEHNTQHLHIIAGGTDKNLDPKDFIKACNEINSEFLTLYLLKGSYTEKILPLLKKQNMTVYSQFDCLQKAVEKSLFHSKAGDIIALSPGCTSFGMFIHEFERGDAFKNIVRTLTKS